MKDPGAVVIAGQEYPLRYTLAQRKDIEKKCGGRNLLTILFSGILEEQATVLWAGISHGEHKRLTVDDVIGLLQKHNDAGGDYEVPIKAAMRSVAASKLLGRVETASFEGALSTALGEDEAPEGKAEAPAGTE